MTKDERIRFTLRMPTELFNKVQKEANKIGCSVNAMVLQILWDWVKENEKKEGENSEYRGKKKCS